VLKRIQDAVAALRHPFRQHSRDDAFFAELADAARSRHAAYFSELTNKAKAPIECGAKCGMNYMSFKICFYINILVKSMAERALSTPFISLVFSRPSTIKTTVLTTATRSYRRVVLAPAVITKLGFIHDLVQSTEPTVS
jgi:hypothetical protein